jgi:hypothetical protein
VKLWTVGDLCLFVCYTETVNLKSWEVIMKPKFWFGVIKFNCDGLKIIDGKINDLRDYQ